MTAHRRGIRRFIHLKPFIEFYLFCSGANHRVLKECPPSERRKYAWVGAFVFLTGSLAALSGGYAIFISFNNTSIALLFGMFWGLLVFNLDRFIVSNLKKADRKPFDQWKQIILRLSLGVFLAVIISKPIELKIFEVQIIEVSQKIKMQTIENLNASYNTKIDNRQLIIEKLRKESEEKSQLEKKHYEAYKCECDGTSSTGKKRDGAACELKKMNT